MGNASLKITLAKGFLLLLAGAFLIAAAVPTNALGSNGSGTNGVPTGNYLFTYYDIGTPVGGNPVTATPNFGELNGDNVLRLIDPNQCGVNDVSCGPEFNDCAMIYVFDDDQEMGECCGCPMTPNELNTYSVRHDLVSNWALATQDNGRGTIVVVGSSFNDPGSRSVIRGGATTDAMYTSNGCGNVNNPTCNDGCSPTLAAITTGSSNLDGSITHDSLVAGKVGLTETELFDQGAGQRINNAYLVAQCGALAGNGTRNNGFCYCGEFQEFND